VPVERRAAVVEQVLEQLVETATELELAFGL
jgi:hypothetical protein